MLQFDWLTRLVSGAGVERNLSGGGGGGVMLILKRDLFALISSLTLNIEKLPPKKGGGGGRSTMLWGHQGSNKIISSKT